MVLLWLSCASPDPTAHLGPGDIAYAPQDLPPGTFSDHRRWIDRYAVVGTRPNDRGTAVQALAKLPDDEAIPALVALLHGRFAWTAAAQLVGRGEAGCQAVFAAWEADDTPFTRDFAFELVDPRFGCAAVVHLDATPRGKALLEDAVANDAAFNTWFHSHDANKEAP